LQKSTENTVYLGNGTSRSMVAMERYVSVRRLDDLERLDMKIKFFRRISLITLKSFDLERPNLALGRITHVGKGEFQGGH